MMLSEPDMKLYIKQPPQSTTSASPTLPANTRWGKKAIQPKKENLKKTTTMGLKLSN